jgi:hypothetical protein
VRPEFTAAPIGIHGPRSVSDRAQQGDGSFGGVTAIFAAADSRNEERHHLVAD